nr:serine protease [Sinorhizobium sp. 7-81]
MVAPGILLTATHVLDEFAREGHGPVFFTFLPGKARAWLPHDVVTVSGKDKFDDTRKIASDLSLVGVTLNSDAHEDFPLNLAAMQVALPLLGERLWAIGFRHHHIENGAARVTPMVSSGLVTAVFPSGRGNFLASPCVEVNMDTLGGMSGGAVVNSEGRVVGIVSTSFEGGPSYITLIWEALRLDVAGAVPELRTRQKVSLQFAASKGLAQLFGTVEAKPWGDVVFSFSGKESELFANSLSGEAAEDMRRRLVRDDIDTFLDEFGQEMAATAEDAAIELLEGLSLHKLRELLAVSDISPELLDPIDSFTVEDFEGVEDPEIISAEKDGPDTLRIDLFFSLHCIIWTVTMPQERFRAREEEYSRHFMNIDITQGIVSLELVQRIYFRAMLGFDSELKEFTETVFQTAAVRGRGRRPETAMADEAFLRSMRPATLSPTKPGDRKR